MKPLVRGVMLLVVLIAVAGGAFWFGTRHAGRAKENEADSAKTQAEGESKAVADVAVAPLMRKEIAETIIAYGTVVAQPNDVRILSVPFEARVRKIRVTAGQQVAADTPVIELESSPTELAALAEAKT